MLRHVLRFFVLLIGIVFASFLITNLGCETEHAQIANKFGNFVQQAVHLNFGHSAVTGQPVLSELLTRWPATLELGLVAISLSLLLGIPLGLLAALRENQWLDHFLIGITLLGYSIAPFWLALLLILLFSVGLDLMPVSGRLDIMFDVNPVTGFMLIDTLLPAVRNQYHWDAFGSAISHLILPATVLACTPTAAFARMVRSSMLNVLSKNFILSARAKGYSPFRVIGVHALRNAMAPVLAMGGFYFVSSVMMGSIVIETIFAWPGIGSHIINSIYARDSAVVQVFLLSTGIFVLCINAVTDLAMHCLHPRST